MSGILLKPGQALSPGWFICSECDLWTEVWRHGRVPGRCNRPGCNDAYIVPSGLSDKAVFGGYGPTWSAPVIQTGTNDIMGYLKKRKVILTADATEVRVDISDLPAAPGNAVLAYSSSGKMEDATSNVDGTELAAATEPDLTLHAGEWVEFEWVSRLAS